MENELQFRDTQRMIDNHREEMKQQEAENYIKARINARKKLKIKKEKIKKKVVQTVLIAGCGAAVAMAGNFAHTQHEGANNLGQRMNEVISTDNYSFVEYSDGYKVNQGTQYVDTEVALNDIVNDARDKGMSYAEITVGLDNYFGSIALDNVIGKDNMPSLSERISVKEKAYHESSLKDINKEVTK